MAASAMNFAASTSVRMAKSLPCRADHRFRRFGDLNEESVFRICPLARFSFAGTARPARATSSTPPLWPAPNQFLSCRICSSRMSRMFVLIIRWAAIDLSKAHSATRAPDKARMLFPQRRQALSTPVPFVLRRRARRHRRAISRLAATQFDLGAAGALSFRSCILVCCG